MFCTHCGKEIPEGARFCTSCGVALSLDDSIQQAETRSQKSKEIDSNLETAINQTKTRSRRYVHTIILVALALALAAGTAYAAYRAYTEVIAPAMQEHAQSGALSDEPSNVPEEDDRVEVSADSQSEAYKQYKQLLDGYADTYGGICVATPYSVLPSEHKSESGPQNLSGLCFAYLVDFDGDDLQELVCSYYDENKTEAAVDYRYVVEVWRYDANAKQIEKVFSVPAQHVGNNGFMDIGLVSIDGQPCICSVYELENVSKSEQSSLTHRYVETRTVEDGQEKVIHSMVQIIDYSDTSSPKVEVYIDGLPSTQEESSEMQSNLFQSTKPIAPELASGKGAVSDFQLTLFESPEQLRSSNTAVETNKTLEKLSNETGQ